MGSEIDWKTGDGLLGISDPAEIDAAFDRGERFVGTAVIGLVMNCDGLAVAAPRVERGLRSSDPKVRQYSFVAAATAARVFGVSPRPFTRFCGQRVSAVWRRTRSATP